MTAQLRLAAAHSPPRALTADRARRELALCRPLARAWIGTIPEIGRRDLAALFAYRAVHALAEVSAPDFQLSEPFARPFGCLDTVSSRLADTVGQLGANLTLQEAAHSISSLYTLLLSSHDRSLLGAFHTPPALAERLINLAEEGGIDWRTARVLDPASGGGALLLPVAERMLAASHGNSATVLQQMGRRLYGLELDPHAAWLGQAAIELLLAPVSKAAGLRVPRFVRVCDTLEEIPSASFDLVVGNPPYGRVALTPQQRGRFARSLYGHANLYGVFTDIAVRWTRTNGMIAYLTPTSLLGGHYFAALRNLLAREAPPEAIDFVCSRKGVFEDALQETLLALYRRGGTPKPIQVHYLKVESEFDVLLERNGMVTLPTDHRAPWLAPRSPDQSRIAAIASKMPTRLADWGYSVSTGQLVWNRFKDQLRNKPGRGCYPLIWAEAITADGRFVLRAEKRNHLPYFLAKQTDGWLLVREPSVLVQRTTAKEQARRLIAAELPAALLTKHGAVVVENHLNMVRPGPNPRVKAATLAAVLNSWVVDQVFRCISGSVAVSAFELEALPLPSSDVMHSIEAMVARDAPRAELDYALAKLYGVELPS